MLFCINEIATIFRHQSNYDVMQLESFIAEFTVAI